MMDRYEKENARVRYDNKFFFKKKIRVRCHYLIGCGGLRRLGVDR